MIIYGTAPGRILPFIHTKLYDLVDKFHLGQFSVSCIIKESDEQWYTTKTPFDWCWYLTEREKNVVGYRDLDIHYTTFADAYRYKTPLEHIKGKNCIVIDEEYRTKYNLLCGVMDIEQIKKEPEDFIFTTMIHPVDRVYEMYSFIKGIAAGNTLKRLTKQDLLLFGEGMGVLKDPIKGVNPDNIVSLERFVDIFIEKKGIFKVYDNLYFNDCNFMQTEVVDGNHDYICFITDAGSVLKTVNFLNRTLHADFNFNEIYTQVKLIRENVDSNPYRRKDLEKFLEKEIFIFRELQHKYVA